MIGFPSILEGIKDLDKAQIKSLISRANDLKNGQPARLPLQKSLAVATSFLENSTRTKLSFAMAVNRLGGFYTDFNAESSSLKKGESLEQTLLTLYYQGNDICIIRTNESHLLTQFRQYPPIKIINGGDGTNQHPTQALLDLMTLCDHFGGISNLKNKTIAIIGDCIHSRVTHSLMDLLPQFGIKLILAGPDFFTKNLARENISVSNNLDETIKKSDVLYLLRVQKERHSAEIKEKISNYHQDWGISFDVLKRNKKALPIMHPGPANIGVEVDAEVVNSEIWMAHKQVKNSIYIRMAIIEAMLDNNDPKIGSRYNKIPGGISEEARKY